MRKFKSIISVIAAILLVLGTLTAGFAATPAPEVKLVIRLDSPRGLVDGRMIQIEPDNPEIKAVTKNDRTFVPLRFCAEALGAQVSWEGQTRTAVLTIGSSVVKITTDSSQYQVNRDSKWLEASPFISSDRMFVPLRAISEGLGYQVIWNAPDRTALIGENLGSLPLQTLTGLIPSYGMYTSGRIPRVNFDPDVATVLDVLKAWNPTGYAILNSRYAEGDFNADSINRWFSGDNLFSSYNTCTHEEYHGFISGRRYTGSVNKSVNDHYIGANKLEVSFPNEILFKSEEMNAGIPASLRTFRFDTYVGKGVDLASNVLGILGLLNEFDAYYQGTKTAYELKEYALLMDQNEETWFDYISGISSTSGAYYEFKFFILRYLLYAKEYHPESYRAILANSSFKTAFTEINRNFEKLVEKDYPAVLQQIEEMLTEKGYEVNRDGTYFYVNNRGISYNQDWEATLKKEMEGSSYQSLLQELQKS